VLQAAGRKFIPVNTAWDDDVTNGPSVVPSSEERPSVTETIDEMQTQSWYKGQISFRQETEGKAAHPGLSFAPTSRCLHLTFGLRNSWDTAVCNNYERLIYFTTDIFSLLPPSRGNQCFGRWLTRHR
jgi:hypothetical protein